MFKKADIGALIGIAIPAIAVLSFHSYLGSMSRFLADDYCVAYFAERFGFFRSIWYWYISWSGTFSTSIFDWLLVIMKTGGIPFVTPVVLIIWVAVTTITVYLFLPQEFSSLIKYSISIAFGALTVFATLLISPDVPQSLYWWTGMRSYILPLVIVTIYSIIFQRINIERGNKGVFIWSIISFCIVFIIGGFSETFTPVLTVFFAGSTALSFLSKKRTPPDRSFFFLLGGMLGSLTSLIVLVIAPGNANRQAFYQPSPGILELIHISISAFLVFISNTLIAPGKIAGILGVFLAAVWLCSTFEYKNKTRPWIPLAILIAGIALSYGCFLPAAWGISDAPPDRNLSIPSFILVVTLIITGVTIGNLLSNYNLKSQFNYRQNGLLVIILACLWFSASTTLQNLYSHRQAFIEYAQKWDRVNQQIIQSKLAGYEVVHIPAMDSWTTLDKPNNNPKFWLNICYSKYYDVKILSP